MEHEMKINNGSNELFLEVIKTTPIEPNRP